jgi:hypothetical protein
MKCVYETSMDKKTDMTKLLEEDPYGEKEEGDFAKMSFTKLGYKTKEGAMIEEDKDKIFVYLKGSDDYMPFVEKKFEGLAKRCEKEVEERIIKKIEDEEAAAEQGMGAIFG